MSLDLAYPPPNVSPEDALKISKKAPLLLKTSRPQLPWPLSIFSGDETPERWAEYETLYLQCLRTGDDKSAKQILDNVRARFGDKNEKVMAFQGLWEEAQAKNNHDLFNVLKIYGEILEKDPTNFPVQKRRIALLKSMDKIPEAVTQLVNLLDVSPTDAEGWAELADLYLAQGLLEQAIFAFEEVLLIAPNAWSSHAKLAEVIYQQSQSVLGNNVGERARIQAESLRRYLRSVELCENYLRGYYGLKLVSSQLIKLIPDAAKSSTKDSAYSDLPLPTEGTVKAIHELATAKLAEIVRKGTAGEKGFDGYDPAELKAARELLDQGTEKIER